MTASVRSSAKVQPAPKSDSEFSSVALLLQGGGALGAYQAGVYEALAEAEIAPDWVSGISIGAINGAIIAGNKPEARVAKLRGFWEFLTANPFWDHFGLLEPLIRQGGDGARSVYNQMNASVTLVMGVPGFFTPHVQPWLLPQGNPEATSFYDTKRLIKTLHRFVDFDYLNSGKVRYTTSAVNVHTGNYTLFDTKEQNIGVAHVMASGALPPGLPAVEIDGEHYWDGGVISNTPLQWVMDEAQQNTLIFQVDLWSAIGDVPGNITEVMTREKEIRYSSRTRAVTNHYKEVQKQRHAFATLYEKLPPELKNTPEAQVLLKDSDINVYNIVHLIYRTRHYEGFSKDFEFSRQSMEEHWAAGYNDTVRSLRHKAVLKLPERTEGLQTFDVSE